jgi:alanine dehydrogenase
VAGVEFLYLDRDTVEALMPPIREAMPIVATALKAHGEKAVVMPPKGHLYLDHLFNGHFNILKGYVAPAGLAGVKVISDYVDNYRVGLPSEIALLTLYDPGTGSPVGLMDATTLTWVRTGSVTGIGARHLARPDAGIVTHIGARGTAFANLEALAAQFPLKEIRIASARRETREALANEVERKLGVAARPVELDRSVVEDADIVVEATRLETPRDLVLDAWMKPGSLLVAYGFVRAVDAALPHKVDRFVVDDWAQCSVAGTFHDEIAAGRIRREDVDAEIGEIVAGSKPGRQGDDERALFWHRGMGIVDVVLGGHILAAARAKGLGQPLKLWTGRTE